MSMRCNLWSWVELWTKKNTHLNRHDWNIYQSFNIYCELDNNQQNILCVLVAQSFWLPCPWNTPGKNTGVGRYALLQGIFPTQGSKPGLPHCEQIIYCLSHQGSSWMLEWLSYSFSRGSSPPGDWTRVSCIVDGFFTSWATREAPGIHTLYHKTKPERQDHANEKFKRW